MDPRPVFVAGLERSGTTLLYALLASHPNIAMTRRTNLWSYFYNQYGDLSDPENLDRCLDTMRRYKRLIKLQVDWDRLRTEFRGGEATYGRLFALVEQQHAARLGKPRWGDKSLNTERYADAIFRAYPNARILHMMRDPRDRYASVQTRWKVRRGGVGGGTAEWLSSARLAQRNQARYPERYRAVKYEALATEPERTLRELCAFIDEDYTPAMLAMQGATPFREQGSNSSYGAREAGVISTDSIGRFRDVLTQRQIAFVQALAGREMRDLGYEPTEVSVASSGGAQLLAGGALPDLARLVGWRIRDRYRNRAGRPVPHYLLLPVQETS